MDKKDIEHLAKLSRIEIPEEEKESLSKDLENILGHVGQIQSASASLGRDGEVTGEKTKKTAGKLRNVMREDKNPHEPGIYTEKILKEAPEREGDYVKVKKIL